jgi:hypothetical protein
MKKKGIGATRSLSALTCAHSALTLRSAVCGLLRGEFGLRATLVRHWFDIGSTLVRHWAGTSPSALTLRSLCAHLRASVRLQG